MPRKSSKKSTAKETPATGPIDWDQLAKLMPAFVRRNIGELERDFIEMVAKLLDFASRMPPTLAYPTSREQSNALIADCVRNSVLERFHAEGTPIGQEEMKALMIDCSTRLDRWVIFGRLTINTDFEPIYLASLAAIGRMYCTQWER